MQSRKKYRWFFAWVLLCVLVPGLLASACSSSPSVSSSNVNASPTSPTPKPTTQASPLPPHLLADLPPYVSKLLNGMPLSGNRVIPLVFRLAYNDTALQQVVTQMYTPDSSTYHHFLTPAQIAQSYALPTTQVQQVVNWLTQQGYVHVSVDPMRASISVQAKVSTIERSLKTSLNTFTVFGRQFFMQQQAPTLPAAIAAFVQSIVGLNDFAQPQVKPPLNATQAAKDCGGYGAQQSLTRNKLAAAYQIDQLYRQGLQGQGMTIGIAEFDEPYDMRDVQNYTACVGIPTPHIQNIAVDGTVPPGFGEGEAAMDVELIAGLAPKANILVYQGNYTGTTYDSFALSMYDVFNKVANDDKVQVLSVSYGIGEEQFSAVDMYSVNSILQKMAAEGISVFASSGDCAAYSLGVAGVASVQFPASAPYIIAVGGTHLAVSNQNRRTREDVWSGPVSDSSNCQNSWGSGGGVSQTTLFKRPPWQSGPGTTSRYNGARNKVSIIEGGPVIAPNGLRQVPDVSAAAFPNIAIYYSGSWIGDGGTSAAAPIWAAGMLLVDQGLKQHHKSPFGTVTGIYYIANHPGRYHPFTDITSGNNLFYPATRGWDYATGWGSPNFNDILQLKLSMTS